MNGQIRAKLLSYGLETHAFNLSQYNKHVDDKFKIETDHDNLVHLIVSRPEYFELAVVPHIRSDHFNGDPVDSAVKSILEPLFPNQRIIYDYDMRPNRLPVMLMQTAFHVAKAGVYYQQCDIDVEKLPEKLKKRKLMGCCIHPEFGGFFSIRAAIITDSTDQVNHNEINDPVRLSTDQATELLVELNTDWQKGIVKIKNSSKLNQAHGVASVNQSQPTANWPRNTLRLCPASGAR